MHMLCYALHVLLLQYINCILYNLHQVIMQPPQLQNYNPQKLINQGFVTSQYS
jgi:hypothetical protein